MELIKIVKDGCGPCQIVDLVIHSFKDELEELGVNLHVINVSNEPKVIDERSIQSVPTIILEKDGREVWRHVGKVTGEELIEAIEKN